MVKAENKEDGLDLTVENTFNYQGWRAGKTSLGKTTYYAYSGDKIIKELDSDGGAAYNVYGGALICRVADGERVYYLHNGHGDVTALVSAAGTILARYYYDAFGNVQEGDVSYNNPYLYAGYVYDPESGLYDLKSRFYDAKIARFMQEDTYLGTGSDPLSLNRFTYCHNNPIRYTDPTGHIAEGDDKYNDATQKKLVALTAAYYDAKSQTERDAIHEQAKALRTEDNLRPEGSKTLNSQLSGIYKDFLDARDPSTGYVSQSSYSTILSTHRVTVSEKTPLPGYIAISSSTPLSAGTAQIYNHYYTVTKFKSSSVICTWDSTYVFSSGKVTPSKTEKATIEFWSNTDKGLSRDDWKYIVMMYGEWPDVDITDPYGTEALWEEYNNRIQKDKALALAFLSATPDTNGIYHLGQDWWQSTDWIGFNDLYDGFFYVGDGGQMLRDKFTFSYGDENFVLWVWKGYYLNLGTGAELGIYHRSEDSMPMDHYYTGTGYAMPMSLQLYDQDGTEIFDWTPEENNWWITGFDASRSYFQSNPRNLTAVYTLDFSGSEQHRGMYEAFITSEDYLTSKDRWSISPDNKYLMTLTF